MSSRSNSTFSRTALLSQMYGWLRHCVLICQVLLMGWRLSNLINEEEAGTWTLIGRHDSTAGDYFTDRTLSVNPLNPGAELFSILDQMENYRSFDGRFYIRMTVWYFCLGHSPSDVACSGQTFARARVLGPGVLMDVMRLFLLRPPTLVWTMIMLCILTDCISYRDTGRGL